MRKHFGVDLICAMGAPLWAAVPPDLSAGVKAYESADYAAALRVFRPAAQKGNAEAQFDLGVMYQRGHGVGKDLEEAFKWLRAAADQGLPQAQFLVGQMREKGEGIAPDYAEAQRWYQLAADSGDPDAANGLAALYEEGFGVSKDVSRAAHWYRLSADQGLPEAQFRLGLLLTGARRDEERRRSGAMVYAGRPTGQRIRGIAAGYALSARQGSAAGQSESVLLVNARDQAGSSIRGTPARIVDH